MVFAAATFKGLWVVSLQTKKENVWYVLVCSSLFCISRGKKTKLILLARGKFSFPYVDIWFDLTKCKFIVKNSSFKMLVVLSLIFVTDTKITFFYNFVAPLIKNQASKGDNSKFLKIWKHCWKSLKIDIKLNTSVKYGQS